MIQSVGSDEPTHYPMPMARFGLNPYGKPIWRIVYTDSVRRLVGGKWPDGKEEYRLARAYTGPAARHKWVLESWISAMEHTGCTPDEYRIRFQAQGCSIPIQYEPYPFEGTYVERHVFSGVPWGVEELIAKWAQDKNVGFAERRRLRQEQIEYQERKTTEEQRYRLRDLQPDPNGLMMLSKQKSTKVGDASKYRLPKMGFSQLQGA